MLNLAQHRDYLMGERHRMRAAHFHLVRRDRPDPLFDVEFFPLRPAQFARADEHMRQNSQGRASEGVTVIVVDSAE